MRYEPVRGSLVIGFLGFGESDEEKRLKGEITMRMSYSSSFTQFSSSLSLSTLSKNVVGSVVNTTIER
jgi:hypothetical protein